MKKERSPFIIVLFAFVPYVFFSWGYVKLIHANSNEFWYALAALLLARLFFSVIETVGAILEWRLYGKKIMVNNFLEILRLFNFPKRENDDDLSNYLYRIMYESPHPGPWNFILDGASVGDEETQYPPSLKTAAKEMCQALEASRSFGGILLSMRMHSAARAALDIYSPRSEASVFGTNAV